MICNNYAIHQYAFVSLEENLDKHVNYIGVYL
jgi:hypothetical protein